MLARLCSNLFYCWSWLWRLTLFTSASQMLECASCTTTPEWKINWSSASHVGSLHMIFAISSFFTPDKSPLKVNELKFDMQASFCQYMNHWKPSSLGTLIISHRWPKSGCIEWSRLESMNCSFLVISAQFLLTCYFLIVVLLPI